MAPRPRPLDEMHKDHHLDLGPDSHAMLTIEQKVLVTQKQKQVVAKLKDRSHLET
jgi:hypothetical protein